MQGKYIATEITNLALESSCIDDIVDRLGDTATRGLLTRRCMSKISVHVTALRDVMSKLEDVCGDIGKAQDVFESLAGMELSMDDPRADVALCTCLTYRQACRIVEEIVTMYRNEMEVKVKVVDDIVHACHRIGSDVPVERGFWHVHIAAWMMDVYVSREIVDDYMSRIALDAGMPYSSPSN